MKFPRPQNSKLIVTNFHCSPFMPLQYCLLTALHLSHLGIFHGNEEAEMAVREWLQKQSPTYTATLFSDSYQDWTRASVCHVSNPLLVSRYTVSLLSCPWRRHPYRLETQHPLGHPVAPAILGDAIKRYTLYYKLPFILPYPKQNYSHADFTVFSAVISPDIQAR